MLAWHGCDNLSLQSLMEPAVVDSNPAVFRGADDIRVALPKTNVGMIVGSSRVHKRQLVEPSKRPALHTHDILEQPQPGGSIADDVVTLVGEANHKGWFAVMALKYTVLR